MGKEPRLRPCTVRGCRNYCAFDLDICWSHANTHPAPPAPTQPAGSLDALRRQAVAYSVNDPAERLQRAVDALDAAVIAHDAVTVARGTQTEIDDALDHASDTVEAQRIAADALVATLLADPDTPPEIVADAERVASAIAERHDALRVARAARFNGAGSRVADYLDALVAARSGEVERAENDYWTT